MGLQPAFWQSRAGGDIGSGSAPVNARAAARNLHRLGLVERRNRRRLRMDPLTPIDTLCRIILRAREYEAQTPTNYDGDETADNVDDTDEETLSVLDDAINTSVEEELK